ncbi:putative C6 transcription factor (Mut3) [Aspergillus thermomutatus]|uniref:Zn(2)-C6 fungal-type domain-containing protein n=1 Tax=Aspergillus thermomutatus TaxID=41047 RepID=A0A397FYC7_ASPTH|nr:uncharacterized protein CDV56_101555 [Aspergillus thermomutatus]RHZ43685.1 hypothetical protein CDV56_101555 [Aspergillus thermomutatus]
MVRESYPSHPRRPTPSHDAAHVLVSFQQTHASSISHRRRTHAHAHSHSHRPLSIPNLDRPPQNRRRVWRACESCRKKKIKCDAGDPCQCCLDTGNECVYAVEGSRRGFVDSQVVEVYGKRIQALEDLVAALMDEQQRLASQITGGGRPLNEDQHQVPVSVNLMSESTTSLVGSVSEEQVEAENPVISSLDQVVDPALCLSGENVMESTQETGEAERMYWDENGVLVTDETDGARYTGLGATVAIINECPGLRSRIREGLMRKGHASVESLLSMNPLPEVSSSPSRLPPVPLMDTLIDTFFRKVYRLFPIIEAEDFQRQYLMLLANHVPQPDFLGLLYSIMTVSSAHITENDHVWAREGYKGLDLGGHFYGMALAAIQGSSSLLFISGNNINTVTALTLLGMYLTQLGRLGEAWRIIGRAVRLGYEMGLHRSPKRMGLPLIDVKRRCQLWWCLYVLDRLLALHLGRPLAIHDSDSDVFFPSPRPKAPGFVAMTHLCRLIGRIHYAVNSIDTPHKWHDAANHAGLQCELEKLWVDLRQWRESMIPAPSPGKTDESREIERYVLLSTYFSAVPLLFRPFVPAPHRSSRWDASLAVSESINAAMECIQLSQKFCRLVPACHYFALHGQNLFVSILTLLHCVRQDQSIHPPTDIQDGLNLLLKMQGDWPLARQYHAIAEEYHAVTREVIESGHRGRCMFDNGKVETASGAAQFDPWTELEQTVLGGGPFPSMPDTTWMNELFHLSPTGSPKDADIEKEEEPPTKRRKTKSRQSVCSFAVRKSIM